MNRTPKRQRRSYQQGKFLERSPSLGVVVADRETYSVDEACGIIGCGKTTLYQLVRDRRLVARKLYGRTLFLRGDLQEFLASLPSAA